MESEFKDQKETHEFVYPKSFYKPNIENQDVLNPKIISYSDKNHTKFLLKIIFILIFIFIIFIGSIYYLWKIGDLKIPKFIAENKISNKIESSINFDDTPEGEGALTAEEIYEKINKSVIGVAMYDTNADAFSDLVGQGSGIIISSQGYIATNAHVVGGSTNSRIPTSDIRVTVIFKDEDKTEEVNATIIGRDRKTDLAVLKIERTGLVPAKFGDSSKTKPGAVCYAIGNPLGLEFYSSMTKGIVSAVNRSLNGSEVKYIQTDAAINPGNSGGALVDSHGRIIGMNTGKLNAVDLEGMGFAIPSETILSVSNSIISQGYVPGRVKLGIVCRMISIAQAQLHDLPIGAYISEISPESDLSKNGIKVQDIIMQIDGINVLNFDVLNGAISKKKIGEKVRLKIFRKSSSISSAGDTNGSIFEKDVAVIEDKSSIEDKKTALN